MEKYLHIGECCALAAMIACFVCAWTHLVPKIKAHAEYRVVTASKALVWLLVIVCFGMMGIGDEMEDYLENAIHVFPWWYNALMYVFFSLSLLVICLLAVQMIWAAEGIWVSLKNNFEGLIWKLLTCLLVLVVSFLLLTSAYVLTHFGYMLI